MLPLWLSPTQVRVASLNEQYNEYAKQTASEIEKNSIRVDVDERNETVGKRYAKQRPNGYPTYSWQGNEKTQENTR